MTDSLSVEGDAAAMLHTNLLEHLEAAEHIAAHDNWTEEHQGTARKLIEDLVTVIRAVLAGHKATDATTCPACQQPWPCAELRTIHRLVKDPDNEFYALISRSYDTGTTSFFH